MIIQNSDGLNAIGNRYFGSQNAADVARAYNRVQKKSETNETGIYAGGRNSQKITVVENGIERKNYDPLPKPSTDTFVRAGNILTRLGDIADEVSTNTDLTEIQRAQYDAEFQYLKQQLKNNGYGNNATASATANPANSKLTNIALIQDSSNVLTASAAASAGADATNGLNNLFLNEGGQQAARLEQSNIAKQTYNDYRKFAMPQAETIEQLQNSYARSQTDPTASLIARYNPRIEQNQNRQSIISLLA